MQRYIDIDIDIWYINNKIKRKEYPKNVKVKSHTKIEIYAIQFRICGKLLSYSYLPSSKEGRRGMKTTRYTR